MDCAKAVSVKTILILVALAFLACPAHSPLAREPDWVTMTSFKDVRRMCLINDSLYILTSGGILAVTDPGRPGRAYLNTDGLGTVDITDLIVDADGQRWITGFGRLIRFDGRYSTRYLAMDVDNNLTAVHRVVDDGDLLWVGTDVALRLFSKVNDGGQFEDYYQDFGDLNAGPAVFDILLVDDSIWLATAAGLAVAYRSKPDSLKSPKSWTTFGVDAYPELGTDTVSRVVAFESEIYFATPKGLFRLDRSPSDTVLTMMPIGQGRRFYDMRIQNDSLFLYFDYGLAVIKNAGIGILPATGLSSAPTTGLSVGGIRWVGVASGGVYQNGSGVFAEYPYTGAPANNVTGITISNDGLLTAGFHKDYPAHYLNGVWYPRDFFVQDGVTSVISDSAGNAWIGTFGNGLWLVSDTVEVNYDENNSSLRGNNDDPPNGERYVVIRGLDTDGRYVYAAAYRALNDFPVAIGDLTRLGDPAGWDSLGASDGITDAFVTSLDYHGGYVAVGTESKGIYLCYVGGDPFDKSDDSCINYTENNVYLISDAVQVVRFSPNGVLWAGTNFGLCRYDWGIDRFVEIRLPKGFGPSIDALAFDSRGNVWAGSSNGLILLKDVMIDDITHFTSLNSGLVDDHVNCLSFDRFTGDLYVGTSSGISVYPSVIGSPTDNPDSVYAFPNPFVIRSPDDRLGFNYAKSFTVRIFTAAGELVRDMEIDEWDGLNEAGQPVASGVYLFVLTDAEGNVGRGKFLLVRE
jgi:hypothetical protein